MINNLKVTNFKSLKDIDLSLSNLNVLTGMNGMGKSSVIQVLKLLRNSYISDGKLKYLRVNSPDLPLGGAMDVLYQFAEDDSILIDIDLSIDHLIKNYIANIGKDYLVANDVDDESVSRITFARLEEEALFNMEQFQYLNSNLIPPSAVHLSNDMLVNNFKNIGENGQYAIHFLDLYGYKFKVNQSMTIAKTGSDKLLPNLEAWLSFVSPGVKLSITNLPNVQNLILNFQFETKSELTGRMSPINVGFGINYVIPIITALLTAEPRKLIIIENPEVYLHPKGQSKIGELIAIAAQTGAQIIIETHSDHIINGIRVATKKQKIKAENIRFYYFDRKIDSTEHYSFVHEMKIDADGRIDYWPDGFMDEWDNNLMELI